jgi:hypothetical protein
MNTQITNGELVNKSTQLLNEEIKGLINSFMRRLEDEDGLWLEKPFDEDESMILWVNGDYYEEREYQHLEHIWYCYNVYKTTPKLGLYREELLERLKGSMIKE